MREQTGAFPGAASAAPPPAGTGPASCPPCTPDRTADQFADVITWAPIGLFRVRRDGSFVAVNRRLVEMLGYASTEDLLARNLERDVYFDPSQRETLLMLVESRGTEIRLEARWRTKAGAPIWVELTGHAVPGHDGSPGFYEGLAVDITEKKELEAQFLRAQRMESIGTLASGIAHDLNNVLAPITMSIAMLRGKITDPSGLKWLNTIDASAVRAAGIVRQVLSFGRGVEGERVPVQPRHIVNEIVKIARETFPRSITISADVPKDLWPINADPTQLHQVLLNLSVNARDAMQSGGTLGISAGNITLDEHYARVHIDAKPGRYVALAVTDSGTGIPRGILEKIFDPFFTTKPPGQGTGLGLSTVQAIVRGHGGFMNVYSEEARGSTFRVYLPVCEQEGVAASRSPEAVLPAGRGEAIMVVDDEPSIREITRGMLESNGYRALTASDGAEALTLYRQRQGEIAAVIIDLMMPGMDGSTAIRALRGINPGVRIIASSGFGAENTVAAAAALGAALFLQKPYTTGTLLRTLDELIHHTTRVDEGHGR